MKGPIKVILMYSVSLKQNGKDLVLVLLAKSIPACLVSFSLFGLARERFLTPLLMAHSQV